MFYINEFNDAKFGSCPKSGFSVKLPNIELLLLLKIISQEKGIVLWSLYWLCFVFIIFWLSNRNFKKKGIFFLEFFLFFFFFFFFLFKKKKLFLKNLKG